MSVGEFLKPGKACCEWEGRISPRGYGQIFVNGRNYNVHRFMWLSFKGPIPAKMCICHTCDNRKCYRLSHLWIGTYKENSQDMVKKGRNYNGRPRDEALIKKIRQLSENGKTVRAIGKELGIHHVKVWRIANEKQWA